MGRAFLAGYIGLGTGLGLQGVLGRCPLKRLWVIHGGPRAWGSSFLPLLLGRFGFHNPFAF